MAADNKLLGGSGFVGVPSAPRGMPQVEVTFDIDANGIVQVPAKDKATGKEQRIRIQAWVGSGRRYRPDRRGRQDHAEEDKRRRELVEAKNNADALIHTTERTLSESGDKVAQGDPRLGAAGGSSLEGCARERRCRADQGQSWPSAKSQ